MNLGEPAYWEVKYQEETDKQITFNLFDWYAPFDLLWATIEGVINLEMRHKILLLGFGRSNIVEFLYGKGFRDITAVDISPTVVRQMQNKYTTLSGVDFLVMDVLEMNTLQDNAYTLVIDKGCVDALFCRIDFINASHKCFEEVFRVLKPEVGIFCSISHALPLTRVPYFRHIKWAIEAFPLEEGEKLYMYCMTKTSNEVLLSRKIHGGEFVEVAKSEKVVSVLDQNMNKSSLNRKAGFGGSVTVTASVDSIAELVAESQDVDS